MPDAQPIYARIKSRIIDHIRSGAWPPGHRVPSENELVASYGISRMTANRALRELMAEGFVSRTAGIGTFVAESPAFTPMLALRNIAEEIAGHGHRYAQRLVSRAEIAVIPALAEEFEDRTLDRALHVVMVHAENDVPVQLEDRYLNPHLVPDALWRDDSAGTPAPDLLARLSFDELEHTLEAGMPARDQRQLLQIHEAEPCLILRRRAWREGRVLAVATFTHPASRYALYSRGRTGARP